MDKIIIEQLVINAIIGTLPHERTQPQPIIIDLEFSADIKKAAQSDNLHDTIDYAKVVERIKDFVAQSKFYLVEALAEQIALLLQKEFHITGLRLKICKSTAIPDAKQVGIIIERQIR